MKEIILSAERKSEIINSVVENRRKQNVSQSFNENYSINFNWCRENIDARWRTKDMPDTITMCLTASSRINDEEKTSTFHISFYKKDFDNVSILELLLNRQKYNIKY